MKEKLKSMFTRNIGMKLISLALGFIIWIIIMSISDPQITKTIYNIPVERRNEEAVTKENMVFEALSGDKVSIKIQGSRSEIENLDVNDFVAYVDFQEIGWVNAVPIHVEPKKEELKDNVEITYQSNEVMSISLQEYETEMVLVEVKLTDVPKDYYAFCSSTSSKLLEITGSKKQVESVDRLVAEVSLANNTESFQTNVKLKAVDADGNEIESGQLKIPQNMVQVEIKLLPIKEVPVVLNTGSMTVSEGFGIADIAYQPKSIQIAAEQEVLDTIQEIVIPYAGKNLMKNEEVEIEIAKYLPEGVYLKSETTSLYLNIEVEMLVSKAFTIKQEDIEVRNLKEGLELVLQQEETEITVYGVQSQIAALKNEDLKLYLDMSTCSGGGVYNVILRNDCESTIQMDVKLPVVVYKKQGGS